MKHFAFVYLLDVDPAGIAQLASQHIDYWHGLGLPEFGGGPFADRSGGLITFDATDYEIASRCVQADPLVQAHILDQYWLKEWVVEADFWPPGG